MKVTIFYSYEVINGYPCPGCEKSIAIKSWLKRDDEHQVSCLEDGGCGKFYTWDHEKQLWRLDK